MTKTLPIGARRRFTPKFSLAYLTSEFIGILNDVEVMTRGEALEILGEPLSEPSKMPCKAFSLSAFLCNRGGKLAQVEGTICSKCYAQSGRWLFPGVQPALERKRSAMDHPRFVAAMVWALRHWEHSGYFRWFASGDIPDLAALHKIVQIVRLTPHIKHWLPTHEVGILGDYIRAGDNWPSNLTVRLSADFIGQRPSKELCRRLGIQASGVERDGSHNCPAYQNPDHACGDCRDCWDHRFAYKTYPLH